MHNRFHARNRQTGAALFMALIFLIIITMLSLASMRSSVMELRMAGNAEARAFAAQRAQAIVDATVANVDNTPVIGGVGETTCMAGATGCNRTSLSLSDPTTFQDELDADYIDVVVTRLSPLEKPSPRATGYSGASYSVATFEVSGSYDGSADGFGSARIVEGVMVLVAK